MATTPKHYFQEANFALKGLTILRSLKEEDQVLCLFEQFLEEVLKDKKSIEAVFEKYHQLLGKLMEHSLTTPFSPTGNLWQDYLLDRLLLFEEQLVFQLALKGAKGLARPVTTALEKDLRALGFLFGLNAEKLKLEVEAACQKGARQGINPDWQFSTWGNNRVNLPNFYLNKENVDSALGLKLRFYEDQDDWGRQLEVLAQHYRESGIGDFGLYHAFRFQKNGSDCFLKPISDPDPIRLSDLVGYEKQKEQVIRNTMQFMNGFPANNLLFYGDRGTGKSSTIKSLVHEFGKKGLRMIEMTKRDLKDLPFVLDAIRYRNHRFIIFIDDLSFEEGEDDYKHLKAVLEGSLEAKPKHVLIYATSNRRHLIKEKFSDRDWTGDEEVRAQDTLQEKLSLGDRFGMTITFTTPDQEQYLQIVEGLARLERIGVESEILREKALKWALWHNGRSGRTARQFIDDLTGRMGMKNGS